jgi:hypothetical protein
VKFFKKREKEFFYLFERASEYIIANSINKKMSEHLNEKVFVL